MRILPGRMHRQRLGLWTQRKPAIATMECYSTSGARALTCGLLWALCLTASLSALADNPEPEFALEMSTSLTFDATGQPPAQAPVTVTAPLTPAPIINSIPAPVAQSSATGLAFLTALLGLLAGSWMMWRRPVDQTPAQNRLSAELARSRQRYLGLLAQRETRRDPAWDSTISTLRADLGHVRTLLDQHEDDRQALERNLEDERERTHEAVCARDAIEILLKQAQDDIAATQSQVEDRQKQIDELNRNANFANLDMVTAQGQIEDLTGQAANAHSLNMRLAQLEKELLEKTQAMADMRRQSQPLDAQLRSAQESSSRLLDKNLALEAEVARLCERQSLSEKSHATTNAQLIEDLRKTKQALELSEARFDNAQRETAREYIEKETALATQVSELTLKAEQSEQAKRRVLSLLQQEKTDASGALSELESLRVDHAHVLEQIETVQKLLGTAEDRIDTQKSQIKDLYAENQALRLEVNGKEDALRATAQSAPISRSNAYVDSSGIIVNDNHPDAEMIAQTIKQLTRSRDAARQELLHLRANLPAENLGQLDDKARTLAEARLTIRSLESDLRLRGDLIDNLRAEARKVDKSTAEIDERDKQIARLKNELALALDETSRMRLLSEEAPRATPRDVLQLRERIDGLQERLESKEKEIAILRAAAYESANDSPLQEHVSRLEADQDASVTVIRFLEGEVKKLSRELKVSTGSRAG